MTRPTSLHHRSKKFWTRVEIARANSTSHVTDLDKTPLMLLAIVLWVVLVGMCMAILSGCKSRGSEGTRVTGTELVKAETYVTLSWKQATGAMKDWLNSALLSIHTASASNERAAREFDQAIDALADETADHQKDNEKKDAEIKAVKSTIGYRVEMFIRRVLSILKWICIGWAVWGVVALVLGKIPSTAAIGGLLGMLWRGFNSFVIGLLPGHVSTATGLVANALGSSIAKGAVG